MSEVKEIKLKIHEENDLYSDYDPDRMLLSEDVVSYFMRNFLHKHRRLREKFLIHIISDTPVNETRVKECIRAYFAQDMEDTNYLVRRLTAKEIGLALAGAILLSIWLFVVPKASDFKLEILCIMGWVGIWEATEIFLTERPELIMMKKNLANMQNAEIVITYPESE